MKETWQRVRALRSQEIGKAAGGARRSTFNAALEQAEQLFTAAATVGTATQPILLFYGLNQLGRAIAAASTQVANSEYRLTGHGIKDNKLQDAANHGLAQLEVRGLDSGAFPTVAQALGCSAMKDNVKLGDLWDLLPYTDRFPLPSQGVSQRLILDAESAHIVRGPEAARARLYPLPVSLQTTAGDPTAGRDTIDGGRIAEEYTALQRFLQDYPTLAGWQTTNTPGQPIPYQHGFSGEDQYLVLPLILPKPAGETESSDFDSRSVDYHGVHYVYPCLDSSGLPAHPFLIWWAALFVLSRLARYQPNEWLELTSVSQSAHAVAIEHILGEALRAVPELALAAIIRSSSESYHHEARTPIAGSPDQ
ncbi:YaaC family protein [Arthrobacter sp. 2RAF22]